MATSYGTLSVSDLLEATGQTIADYGEDNAFAAINNGLQAHNAIVRDMIAGLCEVSSGRLTRYGGDAGMDMVDLDEYGAPDAQKIAAGSNVGFPLRRQGVAIQWTRTYMNTKTPAELAGQFDAARAADIRRIRRDIARAFFTPTNTLTYIDRLTDNAVLPIRAFLNADGAGIPYGPNGESFDGTTHTHYLATAALTAANVSALIETVLEHAATNGVQIWINRAQEAAIRGMTGNFTAFVNARIISADTATIANGVLDMTNLSDRAIGVFDSAEVVVKPWIPAGYLLATDPGSPMKPLRIRTRSGALDGLGALTIAADHEHYPLRANVMDREYGIAPLTRWNGAALYTGGAGYVTPVIAA
ncbi:MAG: hypothetical protein ACR2OO_04020 [Thermomicrobiales bacterium]